MRTIKFFLPILLILTFAFSFTVSAGIAGDVLYSSVTAFINNHAIPSYNIGGDTMVAAEDLANYGFNVIWDAAAQAVYIQL